MADDIKSIYDSPVLTRIGSVNLGTQRKLDVRATPSPESGDNHRRCIFFAEVLLRQSKNVSTQGNFDRRHSFVYLLRTKEHE